MAWKETRRATATVADSVALKNLFKAANTLTLKVAV